jgi:hypothetical protein
MTKHTVDTMADAVLRDLDPAPATALTDAERERADATFARILATPSHDETSEAPLRPRRRWSRLLVPVALVGVAGAAVPTLLLGGSAFGSWTPTPEPLTAAAAREAAVTCRAIHGIPEQGERIAVAERRGGWTYVLITGSASEGFCLMPDDLVGHKEPAEHRKEGFFGGYTTDPVPAPTLAPDRIDQTEAMAGSVPATGSWPFSEDEWFSSVQGFVGSGVTGVTVHTPVGTDVEASVANGRFAAWWPSAKPSSENLEVMGAWTYTVTLANGTTRQVTS